MRPFKYVLSSGPDSWRVLWICLVASVLTAGCHTLTGPKSPSPGANTRPTIEAADLVYDNTTGTVSYTLPEPALVRIRIGSRDGGPLLYTLVDWEQRPDGPNRETWDKKVNQGKVDFSAYKDFLVVVSCLPVDTARQKNDRGSVKGFRTSPRLDAFFPGMTETTDDGVTIVRGQVPLRITIDPRDKAWIMESKYEMSLFIDGIFLSEDEEGIDPYNYRFNTRGINNGRHIITANIVGYEGEVGTVSIPVFVDNHN